MEANGNGILDHLTSSPASATAISQPGPDQDLLNQLYRGFQDLQAQRREGERKFETLLIYSSETQIRLQRENDELRKRLGEQHLDLDHAVQSRRELQKRVELLNNELGYVSTTNQYLKNHNPYVVILIDGDGCHFQKRFIEQGIEGGKQAAYSLRNAILNETQSRIGLGSKVEVSAKYIANLSGLAYATRASGTVENEAIVRSFTTGFTQAMSSFDFIDVGSGKERPDFKIKEAIRWHLMNLNCKQIVVALSFDPGYASFLDEVLRDEESRSRITILEGPPSHRDIVAHRLRTLNLNDEIFRGDKLEALPYHSQNQGYVDRRLSNVTPMTITPPATIAGMSPLPPPPATPSTNKTVTNGHAPPPASYATAIKAASPPPQINLPIPLKSKQANKPAARQVAKVAWNPGARGLDAPLEVHQPSLDNIKKRKEHNKLCNNHYLRGPCAKGDDCCFEHNYRASEQEKTAIAFLARQNPCTSGQECEIEDCIYGHHCPSTVNGQCNHSYCKFKPWEHPPNTKFRPTYSYADEA